jgi:hypothetical protein
MSSPACRDMRQSLGVYVTGAIDPAERMLLDLHLATCAECREELAGLAGLPALLGRVPRHDAERIIEESADLRDLEEPPAELLSRLLREVAARRAAGRWRGIVSAAAAVIFAIAAGVAGAHFLIPGGSPGARPPVAAQLETVRGFDPKTRVTGVISYHRTDYGTAMDVWVKGITPGTSCTLWVDNPDGTRMPAGSWTVAAGHEDADYPASASISEQNVHGFEIWSHGHKLLQIKAS